MGQMRKLGLSLPRLESILWNGEWDLLSSFISCSVYSSLGSQTKSSGNWVIQHGSTLRNQEINLCGNSNNWKDNNAKVISSLICKFWLLPGSKITWVQTELREAFHSLCLRTPHIKHIRDAWYGAIHRVNIALRMCQGTHSKRCIDWPLPCNK